MLWQLVKVRYAADVNLVTNGKLKEPFFKNSWFWVLLATLVAFVLYLSTMQLHINGSNHAYATDVGEIQNALPRWGTIHHSSYPLYSAVGSLFVTALRGLGVAPAVSSSLLSAIFGAVTIGLIVLLTLEMGISGPSAALGALAVAVSTSFWVDASLAEVHTVTLALSAATLLFAMRFGRTGSQRDLLWLTLFFTQAVAHQRSVILLAPAVLILIWPHWREILGHIPSVLLITLLAPLTYLYLPLRAWMGADWIFGDPESWDGFWALFFDNRADRIFEMQSSVAAWVERSRRSLGLLADDLAWPLLLTGLATLLGMIFDKKRRWYGVALTSVWVTNLALAVLIWRGEVEDAQLAAKLPVLIMAGIGLAYLLDWLKQRWRWLGLAAAAVLILSLVAWGWRARSFALTITRDRSVEEFISVVDRVEPFADGRLTTVSTPWGRDFWGITYAQAFRGQLQGLNLVDHNANPREIVRRGDHLLAPLATFYIYPLQWWETFLSQSLFLSTAAPGVVEMSLEPAFRHDDVVEDASFDLGNGIRIRSYSVKELGGGQVQITFYWEAVEAVGEDYSVAVHLVAQDPPLSEADLLDQADQIHPVEGLYPTSKWQPGEIVRDDYLITIPEGSKPAAVRASMYRFDPDEGFSNSSWLTIAVPNNS